MAEWAFLRLDPDEVLHFRRLFAFHATSSVEVVYFTLDRRRNFFSGLRKGVQIKGRERLPDYPVGHRIRVGANNAEPKAGCFKDRCAASHERVSDDTIEVVRTPIAAIQRLRAVEFSQQETSEHCPRPPGKPLMDAYHRTIVLLNGLLSESQSSYEYRIELIVEAQASYLLRHQ